MLLNAVHRFASEITEPVFLSKLDFDTWTAVQRLWNVKNQRSINVWTYDSVPCASQQSFEQNNSYEGSKDAIFTFYCFSIEESFPREFSDFWWKILQSKPKLSTDKLAYNPLISRRAIINVLFRRKKYRIQLTKDVKLVFFLDWTWKMNKQWDQFETKCTECWIIESQNWVLGTS